MTSGENPLRDQATIQEGMAFLASVDADIKRSLDAGLLLPTPRSRPEGFETFLTVIISQQLSTRAARTIKERVLALLPECSPEGVLMTEDDELRSAGMSYRKIGYAKGLAEACLSGNFAPEQLQSFNDDQVIEAITGLKGFGQWSAEMYLMFSLGRPDIMPSGDLAIRVALGHLKGLPARPTPKQVLAMTEHWSPWRSVGALFLWEFYAEQAAPLK